jgi:hypothetical protein
VKLAVSFEELSSVAGESDSGIVCSAGKIVKKNNKDDRIYKRKYIYYCNLMYSNFSKKIWICCNRIKSY